MNSHLPYMNKLIYMLQSKLQTELPEDIKNDISYALYDFGRECVKVSESEKKYWEAAYFKALK